MINYKKQCLLALCFFAIGLFTNNAIAMDQDNWMLDEDGYFMDASQIEHYNECENLRQQILTINDKIIRNNRIIKDLKDAIDSAKISLKSQLISFMIDDPEKYYKKEEELGLAILVRDFDIDTLDRLIDMNRELNDWWDQMDMEYQTQCTT